MESLAGELSILGDQVMNGTETPTLLIQELGYVLSQIDQLASPSTLRAIALEILTSPDIMKGLFQTTLAQIHPDGLILVQCRPKVLRKRLGSRQVIIYRLILLNETGAKTRPVELVGKRYADGAEGEKAFCLMQQLWESGFGEGSRLKIPKPLCYLPDFKLLIQERAPGALLPKYLGRGDDAALVRTRMVARWLAKLHQLETFPEGIDSYADDETSVHNFAYQLGERHPHLASRLEELASTICARIACSEGLALTMVHGDFHPENIFVTQDRVTVIDFDNFCRSDPARDLGYIIAQMRAMMYFSTGLLEAADREIRALLHVYLAATTSQDMRTLPARIATFAARTCLANMYYISCVLKNECMEVLSVLLMEMERFMKAETVENLV
jgi:Phosphotransferase enzyme family